MLFTLIIKSDHLSAAANHAAQFAGTLLQLGHKINCVFFNFEASLTALSSLDIPQGEINVQLQWKQLAQEYGTLPLLVCPTAARRRGINATNIANYFSITGIGELIEAIQQTDRVVQF